MKQKRFICLLLAVFLLLGLMPGAMAAPGVYFTMINSNAPEALSSHTMPLNRNGTIYVPLSTLERLGVVLTRTSSGFLLSGGGAYVHFDESEGTAVTHRGDSLAVSPLSRFGTYFFSVGASSTGPLASHLGISFRLIHSHPAPIVRLYNEAVGILSHDTLVHNADIFYGLTARLDSYLGGRQGGETGSGSVTGPHNPPGNGNNSGDGPPAETPGENDADAAVRAPVNLSLSFVGLTEEPEALLDALYTAGIPAGFFVTAEEIRENADLVRRLHGEGHQLGIYLAENAEAEFLEASGALFAAARLRTVLVVAEDEDVASRADALGLLVSDAAIVREFTGVGGLDRFSGDLLLDSETANPYALAALTSMLRSGAYRVSRIIHSIFETFSLR